MTFDDVIVTAILVALCVIVMAIIGVIRRILEKYSGGGAVDRGHRKVIQGSEVEGGYQTSTPLIQSETIKYGKDSSPSASSTSEVAACSSKRHRFKDDWRMEEEEGEAMDAEVNPRPDKRPRHASTDSHGNGLRDSMETVSSLPSKAATSAGKGTSALGPEERADTVLSAGCDDVLVDTSTGRYLQRALSCDSVMSDTSVNDADQLTNESTAKIGQLEFGLQYDSELSDLVVNVIQAKDLEKNPITESQDSFVKLWLTPHYDDRKYQTKIQKDSVSPQYSERFRFRLGADQLDESVLQFQVYSCDRYARQKLLGETELRLGDIDIRLAVRVWMSLHEMDQRPVDFGDIMFSLAYLPTAERLTVVIAKARNLQSPLAKLSPSPECFVKVHLLQRGKKVAKKKTSKKNDERNPIFNESMTFFVPASSLLSVQLRISVLLSLPDKSADVYTVGHVTVGPASAGIELVHWTQTMTSLRKPVTMWHSLRRD